MPQHSNGKAMSQPSARNMWRLDSEFWSANRAEHRFADGYELVAFDLPAANGDPATIGWELFNGLEYMTLVASGQAASLGEAKDASQAALVQALAALRHPPKLKLPVHINGEDGSYALILGVRSKRPWPAASGGLQEAGGLGY
jgi:hypothetical protein